MFDKGAEVERGPTGGPDPDDVAPSPPPGAPTHRLAGVLGMLGVAEPSLARALEHLAEGAAALVPRADGVVVAVDRPGGGRERCATGTETARVERLQHDLAEGPSLDARRTGRVLLSSDLVAEPRWPRLAARVGPAGLRSALCVPLSADGVVLGHVGAYAAASGAFGDRDRHLVLRWSGAAAQACAQALRADDAREALRTGLAMADRFEVDRAVALLVAEQEVGADEALSVLQLMAATEGHDLVVVARAVVAGESGEGTATGGPRPGA